MSFDFSVGDFVAASQLIASVLAAISSTTVIGQYKPHNSTASDQRPRFEELSRNLGWLLDNIADISGIEDGKDPRLRQAMRTAMEPMRQLQEELAREGFSGIGWKHIELIPYLRTAEFPQLIDDPPPLLFLAACIAYTFAIVSLRSLHKGDRYQDRILGVGCTVGVMAAMISQDPFLELKKYLAWVAFLALVVSSLVHRLLRMRLNPDYVVSSDEGVEGKGEGKIPRRANR